MPNCTSSTLATSAGEYGNLASISAAPGGGAAHHHHLGFQIAARCAAPPPAPRGTKARPGALRRTSVFLAASPGGIEWIGPGRQIRAPALRELGGRGKGILRVPLRKGLGEEGVGVYL